jgi:hypothetical protein
MQRAELTVTTSQAASALRDISLLAYFLEPSSPTDVARTCQMPANLLHHHVKRALEAGVLFEVKRESRKVFYQLTARVFKVPRELMDTQTTDLEDIKLISRAFTSAYTRSDQIAGHLDPEYAIFGFGNESSDPRDLQPTFTDNESTESHPAHLHIRTLCLTPSSYKKLAGQISKLLLEAERNSKSKADACSFAFLAWNGAMREGQLDSQTVNSYLTLPNDAG